MINKTAYQCRKPRRHGFNLRVEDPPEKEMVTNLGTLAWEILWTEKPGRLQSIQLKGVRHD